MLDRYFGVVKYFDRVVNNFGLLTEIKFSRSDTPRTWKVYAANVRNKEFADGSLVTFSAKEGRLGSIGDVERVIRHTDTELIGMLQVALERDDRYLLTVYNNVNKRKALLSNRLRERLITFLFGRLENATSPTAAHFNNIFIISSASGYSLPSGLIDRLYQMLDKASAAVIREVAPRTKQFANQLNALQLRSLSYLLIDKLIDPSFINTLPYPRPSVQEEMHAVLILLHSIAAPEEAFHFFTKICLEKLQSAHIAAFLVHKLKRKSVAAPFSYKSSSAASIPLGTPLYEDETDVIQPSFIFANFFPAVINSLPSEAFEIARIRHDATKWLPEITQRIVNCELIADNVTLQRIYRTTFDDNLLKLLCKQNPIDGFSLAIHALYEDELTQLEGGNLQKIRELLLIATPEAARKAQYTLGQLYTKHGHQWLIAHLWTGELSDLREATKLINARKHTHDVTEEVAKATSLARLLIPKIDFKGLCVLRSFMSDLDYEIISPEKLISEAEGLAVFEYKELESLSLGLEEAKLSLSELNRSKALTIKASLSDEALMKLASLYDSCQFLAAALTDKWNRILIDESRGAPITSSRRIKPDWLLFHRVLEYNDVKYLYHFTDRANLQSIKAQGGLLSWWHCKQKSIGIARPGGGTTSQNLDQHYGLEDFVRLSFAAEHPMMHVALKDGRIQSPIVLKIDPSICFLEDTRFSNLNATKTGHSNGATLAHLEAVKFYVVSDNYFDLSTEDKHYYQAEVLVKTWVPLRYITNLDRFI